MKILALDLGTNTGIACNWQARAFTAPAMTIKLAQPEEVTNWGRTRLTRRCDPRIQRLFYYLRDFETPDLVVFEDVEFSTFTKQTQLWSAFRTVVWLAFPPRVVIECVPVTALKKFAAGFGCATKEHMKRALFTQCPEVYAGLTLDDNAIDAYWILKWAEKNLSRMRV